MQIVVAAGRIGHPAPAVYNAPLRYLKRTTDTDVCREHSRLSVVEGGR